MRGQNRPRRNVRRNIIGAMDTNNDDRGRLHAAFRQLRESLCAEIVGCDRCSLPLARATPPSRAVTQK